LYFYNFEEVSEAAEAARRGATRNTRRLVVIAIFTVACMLLLSWRIEIQQRDISRQQRAIAMTQYKSCVQSNIVLNRFNGSNQALADIERTQTTNPRLARDRISAYTRAIIMPLFDCGPEPRRP
jgi:hypothetical protein